MLNTADIITVYVHMLESALPITIVFGCANILVTAFVTAFSKGKIKLGVF